MMNVKLLSFCGPAPSGRESEVEIVGTEYACDLWAGFVVTVDDKEEPIEHGESGKNSENHAELPALLDSVIERTWRTEIGTTGAFGDTPDNPVGFLEDF